MRGRREVRLRRRRTRPKQVEDAPAHPTPAARSEAEPRAARRRPAQRPRARGRARGGRTQRDVSPEAVRLRVAIALAAARRARDGVPVVVPCGVRRRTRVAAFPGGVWVPEGEAHPMGGGEAPGHRAEGGRGCFAGERFRLASAGDKAEVFVVR